MSSCQVLLTLQVKTTLEEEAVELQERLASAETDSKKLAMATQELSTAERKVSNLAPPPHLKCRRRHCPAAKCLAGGLRC